MALRLDIINGHMARAYSDFPLECSWNGRSFAAIRSQPQFSQTLEVGGPDEKVEFDLFVRRSSLPALPKEGAVFVVGGIKMRVISVRHCPEAGEQMAFGMGYAKQGDY